MFHLPQFFYSVVFEAALPASLLVSVLVSLLVSLLVSPLVSLLASDELSLGDDLRLSVMYQPEPLKMIPAG